MTRSGNDITEHRAFVLPGWLMFIVLLAVKGVGVLLVVTSVRDDVIADTTRFGGGIVLIVLSAFGLLGFFLVFPNEAKVLTLLGNYLGTEKNPGWYWTIPMPIALRERVSLRIQNFDCADPEGQRLLGEPDRGRCRHRLARRRHGEGVFRRRGLRGLRPDPDGDCGASHGERVSLRPYEDGQVSLRSHADEVTPVAARRAAGPASAGRRRGDPDTASPPRVRTGDRRGHASPSAGRSRRGRAVPHRRGRRDDGRRRADALVRAEHRRPSTKRRRRRWSRTCSSCLCSEHHVQPVVNAGCLYQ